MCLSAFSARAGCIRRERRPTAYSPEAAELICDRLVDRVPLRKICKDKTHAGILDHFSLRGNQAICYMRWRSPMHPMKRDPAS
jgi:hypothetical protein